MDNVTSMNDKLKEEVIEDDPELADLFSRAQTGDFKHTMFEIWEDQLNGMILATKEELGLAVADSILRSWPWLSYSDLSDYIELRLTLLNEALDILIANLPKKKEELYAENEDDWEQHQDAYIVLLAEWSKLSNEWAERWKALPLDAPDKGLWHAVVVDVTGALVGPNGVVEGIQSLRDFALTDEHRATLNKLISGEDDE